MPTPLSSGGSAVTSSFPKKILPPVGFSRPQIMFSVVLFPQPDGPSRAISSPSGISKEKSLTAVTSPPFLPRAGNFFVRFCSSIFIATSVFCRRRAAFHSGEIGRESNFQGKISDFSRFSMFSAAVGRHSVLLKLNTSDYSGFPGGSQDLREILL